MRREAVESAWASADLPLASLQQHHLELGDEHYLDVIALINSHLRIKPEF